MLPKEVSMNMKNNQKQFPETCMQTVSQHVPPTKHSSDRMVPVWPISSPSGSRNPDKGPEAHLGKAGAVQGVLVTGFESLYFYQDCFPKLLSLSRNLLRRSCPLLCLYLWRHSVAASAAANGSTCSNDCKQLQTAAPLSPCVKHRRGNSLQLHNSI
jgi:hypothetical protein